MKTGDKVKKVGGDYQFEGVIVSSFQKKSGALRFAVEDDRGVLHIYSEKNLEPIVEDSKCEVADIQSFALNKDYYDKFQLLRAENEILSEACRIISEMDVPPNDADPNVIQEFCYKAKELAQNAFVKPKPQAAGECDEPSDASTGCGDR
jgi:hypothetical protein